MRWAFAILCLFSACDARAAYRLYELQITYMVTGEQAFRQVKVVSNLDPNQWTAYHNDYSGAKVEMLDHWYCPGDTSHHKPCPKPKVNDRTPAMTYPERDRLK